MHILDMTCFCYVQNKMKLDPRCEKGIFVGYDKQSPAYLIYFLKSMAIKRVRCVNSPLTKQDKNTELLDYISTASNEEPKDNLNTEGEGQIRQYPIQQRRKPFFCSQKL